MEAITICCQTIGGSGTWVDRPVGKPKPGAHKVPHAQLPWQRSHV